MTLFEAVEAGDAVALEQLAQVVIDINEVFAGGRTALIEAAARGQSELVAILLAYGADTAWRDSDQETALLKAAVHGHHRVVNLLAPMATDDERSMARSLLSVHRTPFDPDVRQDPRPQVPDWKRSVASAAAKLSTLLGDDRAQRRLDRVERSEWNMNDPVFKKR